MPMITAHGKHTLKAISLGVKVQKVKPSPIMKTSIRAMLTRLRMRAAQRTAAPAIVWGSMLDSMFRVQFELD